MLHGRELDKLIASKVMGWTDIKEWNFPVSRPVSVAFPPDEPSFEYITDSFGLDPRQEGRRHKVIPHYSTNPGDAWAVLTKLDLSVVQCKGKWLAGYINEARVYDTHLHAYIEYCVEAPSMPLAVCNSALLAVEEPTWP